ncbi:lipase 1-like [Epargyreus clarus]|uniref:lipase 1-like n=1 Tax=Epargyreus clarus TaxID=520877 RepID=UPI003C2F5149
MLKVLIALLYVGNICDTLRSQPRKLFTYSLPDKRPLKQALGYIEDSYFNFTELATKYEFTSEEHIVKTSDGYLLTIFRILTKCNTLKRYPVLLMHGIYDSSDAWILSGPQTGLGYILSRNCYDVWAGNNRGNRYSRKHVRLNPDRDVKFWDFSFDEIGNFDIPAIIDYMLSVSKKSKVYYIGHSQGTTDFFVMTSLQPSYNDKVQLAIQLAPVSIMKHITNPILKVVAQGSENIKNILDSLGLQELSAVNQIEHFILEKLCQVAPAPICGTILYITTGYKQDTISARTLTIAFGHLLVGVSAKTLAHFGQLILFQKFQRYNEGLQGNLKRYGSVSPPEYNVSQITCPIVLVCGQNDYVSTLQDIDELSSKLPNVVEKYIVPDPTFSHNNHVWGVDAPKLVFKRILQFFSEFDKT